MLTLQAARWIRNFWSQRDCSSSCVLIKSARRDNVARGVYRNLKQKGELEYYHEFLQDGRSCHRVHASENEKSLASVRLSRRLALPSAQPCGPPTSKSQKSKPYFDRTSARPRLRRPKLNGSSAPSQTPSRWSLSYHWHPGKVSAGRRGRRGSCELRISVSMTQSRPDVHTA